MTTQREPQIGDKIKLTGSGWSNGDYGVDLRGQVVTIDEVHNGGAYFSYTTDSDDSDSTFLYRNGQHIPNHFEAWHFADQTAPSEACDEDEHIAIGDWVVMTNKAYGTRHPGVYKVVDRTEFGVGGVEITIQRDVDRKFRAGVNDFRKALKAEAYPQILNESIDAEVAAEQAYDMVDPLHYKGFSNGAEPIDILEHLTPNCAAAGKYIIRVGHKPGNDAVQELEKAIRYLRREINLIEGNPSW